MESKEKSKTTLKERIRMKAKKILNAEISELKVSSLPNKPTAPAANGGKGYGAKEMKEAFDKLPLFIIERFNALIDDINSLGEESFAASIKTGLKDGHTLYNLFTDVTSGEFGTYFKVFGESLVSHIINLRTKLGELEERISMLEKKEDDHASN